MASVAATWSQTLSNPVFVPVYGTAVLTSDAGNNLNLYSRRIQAGWVTLSGSFGGKFFTNSATASFGYTFSNIPYATATMTNVAILCYLNGFTTSNCVVNFPTGTNAGGNFIVSGPP